MRGNCTSVSIVKTTKWIWNCFCTRILCQVLSLCFFLASEVLRVILDFCIIQERARKKKKKKSNYSKTFKKKDLVT